MNSYFKKNVLENSLGVYERTFNNRTFACGIIKERVPKEHNLKGSFSSLSLRNCKGKVHAQVIKSRGFSEHKT